MLIDWLHKFVVFDRSSAQFGFNMLNALLFFVSGRIAEDEVHILECLYKLISEFSYKKKLDREC